jgi:hypothetical protein
VITVFILGGVLGVIGALLKPRRGPICRICGQLYPGKNHNFKHLLELAQREERENRNAAHDNTGAEMVESANSGKAGYGFPF